MSPDLALTGCAPTPLSSYLKAIGVLRLLSAGSSHRSGFPADAAARGRWSVDRFHLTTTLNRDELVAFFCHDYAPTPIIAPWNSASGFYPKDNKDGYTPLTSDDVAERFTHIAEAIRIAATIVQASGLAEKPSTAQKAALVESLRASLPDSALDWLDAALALSADTSGKLLFPKLLGTGGNDGRLEFTRTFLQRLVSAKKPTGLFDAHTGMPGPATEELCRASLFGDTTRHLVDQSPGQFSPGAAGGPNASVGFEGASKMNPWDFVLLLEGSVAFAGTAARRHAASPHAAGSFPFAVRTVSAGAPGVAETDSDDARGEFWAPLWSQPARYCELAALFGEGRAVVRGQTATDACDFARSAATLGVSRGIDAFQRYAFHKRAGNAYVATPLQRQGVRRAGTAELVTDLDGGGWLAQVQRRARDKEAPTSLRRAVKRIEDAIFGLADTSAGPEDVQDALAAIGALASIATRSPKQRERLPPPPVLGSRWLQMADDASPEFRVAAAVASICAVSPTVATLHTDDHNDSRDLKPSPVPILAHIAPVRIDDDARRLRSGSRRDWLAGDSGEKVVWTGRNMVRDMISVMQRRLLLGDGDRNDKGLNAVTAAPLRDVARFILGPFDDTRYATMFWGFVWAQAMHGHRYQPHNGGDPPQRTPFAYDAIKPCFTPEAVLLRVGALHPGAQLPGSPTLLRMLSTATGRDASATNTAVAMALRRCASSGIRSAYDPSRAGGRSALSGGRHFGAGIRGDRLAASMLIPIDDHGVRSILRSAYPDSITETATHDDGGSTHDN